MPNPKNVELGNGVSKPQPDLGLDLSRPETDKTFGVGESVSRPNDLNESSLENNLLPKSFGQSEMPDERSPHPKNLGLGEPPTPNRMETQVTEEKPVNLSNFSMILHGDEPGINYSTNSASRVNYKNNYESDYRNYKNNASKSRWNGNKRIYKEIMNRSYFPEYYEDEEDSDPESMLVYKKRKY